MENKKVTINENSLKSIISECITEVLNEVNEGKTFSAKNPDDFKKMRNAKGYNRKQNKPSKKVKQDDENLEESRTSVKLTEEQLTQLVTESTLKILKESDMNEGWFGSVGKGISNMVNNGGGLNGFRSAYNDARANDMQNKAQAQTNANSAKEQQIRNKYEAKIRQLQNQMEQELAQLSTNQQDYSGKAQNYTNKAINARRSINNANNPQDTQPMEPVK